jgi:hypothetical protein
MKGEQYGNIPLYQMEAMQDNKLRSLQRGKTVIFSELPSTEACTGRLIYNVKQVAERVGIPMGANGQTPYSYLIQRVPGVIRLTVRRKGNSGKRK